MNAVYITISDPTVLKNIIVDGQQKGLFKNLAMDKIEELLESKTYPLQIPVVLDNLVDLIANPIVRKIAGKKMDSAVDVCLQKLIEAE